MLRTLKTVMRQDREKFKIPKSVQQAIPIQTIWKDGIFLVGKNKYAKTYRFTDINFEVASEEDKRTMFLDYISILNFFDCGATTKLTIIIRRLNKEELQETVFLPMQNDRLDKYRKEVNDMLMEKTVGANGMIRELYVTISVYRKNVEDARNYFLRTGNGLISHFSNLGSKCEELDAQEKLHVLHSSCFPCTSGSPMTAISSARRRKVSLTVAWSVCIPRKGSTKSPHSLRCAESFRNRTSQRRKIWRLCWSCSQTGH